MSKKLFITIGVFVSFITFGIVWFIFSNINEPEVRLSEITFKELPGWKKDNIKDALPALYNSCIALEKIDPNKKLSTEYIDFGTPLDWKNFCQEIKNFKGDNKELYSLLEKYTIPYKLILKEKNDGIFTGYYEAELKGSMKKNAKYNVPVYGRPYDMVQIDLRDFAIETAKPKFFAMIKDGKVVPYVSRKDFEKSPNAPILLWVDSKVDLFILQIQGSGKVKLENGKHIKLGYDSNNEHPFIGIGSLMKEKGLLKQGQTSMPEIKNWLLENPEKAEEIMAENPRYIFFKINEKDGPVGALGVPLTPKRSLAVDTKYIALGMPLWLDTVDADGDKIQQLVTAQDIGKAIKGKIRGDFFWGFGEEAFLKAGRMKSTGEYFIFLPKK